MSIEHQESMSGCGAGWGRDKWTAGEPEGQRLPVCDMLPHVPWDWVRAVGAYTPVEHLNLSGMYEGGYRRGGSFMASNYCSVLELGYASGHTALLPRRTFLTPFVRLTLGSHSGKSPDTHSLRLLHLGSSFTLNTLSTCILQ